MSTGSMWRTVARRLTDPQVLRSQLGVEADFILKLFPLNLLGSEAVPRVVRYAGYRLGGMKVKTPNIFPGLVIAGKPSLIEIGEDSFLSCGCLVEGVGRVRLGRNVQVGPQAAFITSHHPRLPDGTVSRQPVGLDVTIGDGCWIGARAVILPGVTLAEDCIIAGGAVVTKDCLVPGAVYGGVPARLIKQPGEDYLSTHPAVTA